MGRMNDFDFLSGNNEVDQEVLPIVTATFTEPKPLRLVAAMSLTMSEMSEGKVMKCQGPSPLYNQMLEVN